MERMFPPKKPSTMNSHDRPMCVQGDSGLVLTTDPKPRLRWTVELHERFVDAVAQLGGPDSTILNTPFDSFLSFPATYLLCIHVPISTSNSYYNHINYCHNFLQLYSSYIMKIAGVTSFYTWWNQTKIFYLYIDMLFLNLSC